MQDVGEVDDATDSSEDEASSSEDSGEARAGLGAEAGPPDDVVGGEADPEPPSESDGGLSDAPEPVAPPLPVRPRRERRRPGWWDDYEVPEDDEEAR